MTDNDESLPRRKVDLLLQTGKVLMESAASTNQTMICMRQLARHMGIPDDRLSVDIRYTALTVDMAVGGRSFCRLQKIERHAIDMAAFARVVALVSDFARRGFSLDEYAARLATASRPRRNFPAWVVAAGAGFACGGFCKLFGGDWPAFLVASACAAAAFDARRRLVERGLNFYFACTFAAFLATCLAFGSSLATQGLGLSATPYHPMLACALFIVPGVPLINFVDDMLDNQLLVGLTRFANTMMIVGALTFGISFAIGAWGWGGFPISELIHSLSLYPGDNSYLGCGLAAAVSAMGFSMIFNVKRRWLPFVAAGGVLAVLTRNACNYGLGLGPVASPFVAALVASVAAVFVGRRLGIPNHALSIPSVIPMVPGVLMYRSVLGVMRLTTDGSNLAAALQPGVTSALVILCIALGVAFPSILMRMRHRDELGTRFI